MTGQKARLDIIDFHFAFLLVDIATRCLLIVYEAAMSSYLYIDNYRGFCKSIIPIRAVNFLVGENSTGKSSFLEVVELFYQAPFWFLDPSINNYGSKNRHFLDLVSAASKDKKKFTIGAVEFSTREGVESTGIFVTYENVDGRPQMSRVSLVDSKRVRTIQGRLWNRVGGDRYKYRTVNHEIFGDFSEHDAFEKLSIIHLQDAGYSAAKMSDEISGVPFLLMKFSLFFPGEDKGDGVARGYVPEVFRRDVIDLAPIRSKPKRTYDAPQTEYSSEGEHTPYVISRILSNKKRAVKFADFLKKIGKESGLFEDVIVRKYGKSPLAPFEIRAILGPSALSVDSVGYGVSQALPVIVEIFVRDAETVFLVQQPEVHLHPRAQAAMGDMIAEFSRSDGKAFFVETHSDFTIDRFRLNVRENGSIDSQILFFERSKDGNSVSAIGIDEGGHISDAQPDGYRSFFLNESLSLLG